MTTSVVVWVGIALSVVLVAMVVYVCVAKREITWNAIVMAMVAFAFAGISAWTRISIGPGGIDFEKFQKLEKQLDETRLLLNALNEKLPEGKI